MDSDSRLKYLFERFLDDKCSEEEIRELQLSLRTNSVSEELSPLLEKVWATLDDYPSLDLHHSDQLLRSIKARTTQRKSKRRAILPLNIAAVLALLIAAVWIFDIPIVEQFEEAEAVNYVTKFTEAGQRAVYTLPDGSTATLNAGSSITFPEKFDTLQRIVKLKGEAFFEVKKQPDHPFIVESSAVKTSVLGTSFNVRAYQGQNIEVTVLTGKVKVESSDSTSPKASASVLLTPSQQATYHQKQKGFIRATVNPNKYLAWYTEEIVFENTSMQDVAIMLEKRFSQKIVIENEAMRTCTIRKAKYKQESLETILKGLQTVLEFEYEFDGQDRWTISGKGCGTNAKGGLMK